MLDDYDYVTVLSVESMANSDLFYNMLEEDAAGNTEVMDEYNKLLDEAAKVSIRTAPENKEFKKKNLVVD